MNIGEKPKDCQFNASESFPPDEVAALAFIPEKSGDYDGRLTDGYAMFDCGWKRSTATAKKKLSLASSRRISGACPSAPARCGKTTTRTRVAVTASLRISAYFTPRSRSATSASTKPTKLLFFAKTSDFRVRRVSPFPTATNAKS